MFNQFVLVGKVFYVSDDNITIEYTKDNINFITIDIIIPLGMQHLLIKIDKRDSVGIKGHIGEFGTLTADKVTILTNDIDQFKED